VFIEENVRRKDQTPDQNRFVVFITHEQWTTSSSEPDNLRTRTLSRDVNCRDRRSWFTASV